MIRGLLDTSVVIAVGQGRRLQLPDELFVSAMTLGELHVGVLVARDGGDRAARLAVLSAVESTVEALPIDAGVARAFGRVVARAREAGHRPKVADALIAATAASNDLPLVTLDQGFSGLGVNVILPGSAGPGT